MMEKSNRVVPKMRFKEFEGLSEWQKYKLADYADFRRGAFPQPYGKSEWYDGSGSMPFVQVVDVGSNLKLVDKTKQKISVLAQPKSIFVRKNTVVVTLQGSIGRVAITQYDSYLDRTLLIFQSYKEKTDKRFWAYTIQQKFNTEKEKAPGGTIKTITKESLSNFEVFIPTYGEQQKIGHFFEIIDEMIQLQQSKVNKVKDIKSAYLSEMFPKEGEKYPKKRFEGFIEPWKKYNLGEIGYTISGVGFPNSEQGGKKGIMFLKVSDMNLSENTTEINTSNNFVTAFQVHKRNWKVIEEVPALIFAKVGAALLLDRKRLVNDKFLIDNNMMAYILGEKLVADFTNALFKKIYLPKYAQIGALPSMNDSIVEKIEVLIPSLEEQVKIGKLFKNLDSQITIEEKKLAKLEKLKQAYLNNMFV